MKTNGRSDPGKAIFRLNAVGGLTVFLLFGGLGGWAYSARLSGAVIASGSVVVESNVKDIQHPAGGVVGRLNVVEGSAVKAGDVLLQLDDTVPRTTLGIVRSDLDAQLLRQARLAAERDGALAIVWPEELVARGEESDLSAAFAGEARLFEARRTTRSGQSAQLREKVGQLEDEIRALEAQRAAKKDEYDLVLRDLAGISDLYERKLVSVERLTELERERARLRGEQGQLDADMARVRGTISETELKILQLDRDFQAEVLDDLRETDAKIAELRERKVAAEDQLRRIDIRSPQDGIVHGLVVHAAGAVVEPGEAILSIVPEADALVFDLRVDPRDIDRIEPGSVATVRLLAANQRTTAPFPVTVTRISPDLVHEPQAQRAYYIVRVVSEPGSQSTPLHLRPGMPVEGYIATGMRTPMQYLLEPIEEQIARTFRER